MLAPVCDLAAAVHDKVAVCYMVAVHDKVVLCNKVAMCDEVVA